MYRNLGFAFTVTLTYTTFPSPALQTLTKTGVKALTADQAARETTANFAAKNPKATVHVAVAKQTS